MNPLIENISWLKNKVQEDLFPYLQGCFSDPMTDKQKRLIAILEGSRDRELCENTGIAVVRANAQGPLSDSASICCKGRLSVSHDAGAYRGVEHSVLITDPQLSQ